MEGEFVISMGHKPKLKGVKKNRGKNRKKKK